MSRTKNRSRCAWYAHVRPGLRQYATPPDCHNRVVLYEKGISQTNNPFSHFTSQQTVAIERYSVSADDLDTVLCFFVFHDTGELPNIMKYPVVDRLVTGQLAQSESQYAYNCMSQTDGKNSTCPGFPFRYRTTRRAASHRPRLPHELG